MIDQHSFLSELRKSRIFLSVDNEGKLAIDAPQGVLTESLVEAIKARKEDLLNYLQHVQRHQAAALPIPRTPVMDNYMLSSSQLRLWMIQELDPGSTLYNIPVILTLPLEAGLDIEKFRRAIGMVIERHEILRTVFRENEEGEVRQWVLDPQDISFTMPFMDVSESSDPRQEAMDLIEKDRQTVFDLWQGPLLRGALFRLPGKKYLFYFSMHHIISDGWSMELLSKEVFACYDALVNNYTPELPVLAIQYKDYALWQQAQLSTEKYAALQQYWIHQLQQPLPLLQLPLKLSRTMGSHGTGGNLVTVIDQGKVDRLKRFCQERKASLFMGLLAALNVLLHRYSEQEDIVIGSPIAGRQHSVLENQIGFYLNTLALRTRFNRHDHFETILQHTRKITLEAYEHQDYPFDQLAGELGLKREASGNLLFNVMMVLQNQNLHEDGVNDSFLPGIIIDEGRADAKFDLNIEFFPVKRGLGMRLGYRGDGSNKMMATRLVQHYDQLLQSLMDHPQVPVETINYLPAAERQLVLEQFNHHPASYHIKETVVDLFLAQCRRTPQAVAVVYQGGSLTYSALDTKSNQLAAFLKASGVKENILVPVCLERSPEMIIALLGILKAGGAYVPIDPGYPVERVNYMVCDSQGNILITHHPTVHLFEAHRAHKTILLLDSQWFANAPASPPDEQQTPGLRDLAYVMYTSGSTGMPKGVMIEHKSLSNYLQWAAQTYFSGEGQEAVGLYSSLSFDLTVTSLWGSLITGKKLYLFPPDQDMNELLTHYLEGREQLGVIKLTPAHISLAHTLPIEHSPVSVAIVGGEQLQIKQVQFLKRLHPEMTVYNEYGPTEATVGCIVAEVPADATVISIGQPIPQTTVYLLDAKGQPVPVGVPGELYLGGDQLSRGYWNNEALTREKFIHAPFHAGERLYKTGDVGRWLEDGTIEYVGRKDDQVKIRGYRIELGEIEQAFLQLKIEEAVVTTWQDEAGQLSILAYIKGNHQQTHEKLLNDLKKWLPGYMLPAQIIQVDEFPLTINGKIDRKALPSPQQKAGGANKYIAPENAVQLKISQIWQELLAKKEPVGITEDFFLQGGHSLRVMQLINRYQQAFGVRLSMKQLFENVTIASQAAILDSQQQKGLPQITRTAPATDYPVTDGQWRLWVLSQNAEASLAYHMFGQMHFKGELNLVALERAIAITVERHEILRTFFKQTESGELRQVIIPMDATQFSLHYFDWPDAAKVQVQELIHQQNNLPFDLGSGPLFRAGVVRLQDDLHLFYYTIHHLICDGWSLEIMNKEIDSAYTSLIENGSYTLPAPSLQYRDYAIWQQQQLQEGFFAQHRQYWLRQLEGELPVLELPSTHVRPPVFTYRGHRVATLIPQEEVRGLLHLCRQQHATLFMGVLAILKALFYRYTGQQDIIVGSPASGRNMAELENQIGYYVNTIPLRTRFSGEDSFVDLLQKVRDITIEAYEFQSYPFDRLVNELITRRDTSRSALFDVLVTMQTSPNGLPSGNIQQQEKPVCHDLGETVVKFDLSIDFTETNEGLYWQIDYNRDIYGYSQIRQWMGHFRNLLQEITRVPEQPLWSINYLDPSEKDILLNDFNATFVPYNLDQTFVEIFEQQAIATPDHIAVVHEATSITYRELREKSNYLAQQLSTVQVKEGHFIPLVMTRGIDYVVAFMAVLKTGAAPVPFSVYWPPDRLQKLFAELQAPVVLANAAGWEQTKLPAQEALWYIAYQQIPHLCHYDYRLSPAAPVYMFYTSGSTGMPKGAIVTHQGLLNRLLWMDQYFGKQAAQTVLRTTKHIFDSAVWQLFWPLLNGGKSIIPSEHRALNLDYFMELVKEHGITMTDFSPSLFQELVNEIKTGTIPVDLHLLREIIIGGDAIPVASANFFRERLPHIRLTNLYGPTEASIGCIYHELMQHDYGVIPIGKPVSNVKIYITDPHFQLLPLHATGEICISGVCLGQGYYNDEAKTAEKFVPNPFRQAGDTVFYNRMYRTGDLGRWLPDGSIEFRGRADHQVKIRGHRIELGEIEQTLFGIEGVTASAVIVRQDEQEKYLAAYLCIGPAVTIAEIRQRLREILPEYMIPRYLIELDVLPLTSGGKVNRAALPDPKNISVPADRIDIPVSSTEIQVAMIWQEVLNYKDEISVHEDFFMIGGHSLRIIQLINRYLRSFSVKLTVTELIHHTSIRAHAALIDQHARVSYSPIEHLATADDYPASYGQWRLWVLGQTPEGALAYNMAGQVILSGEQNITCWEKAVRSVVVRHEILRTVFRTRSTGELRQIVIPANDINIQIEYRDFPCASREEVNTYIRKVATQLFNLEQGPLFRMGLIKMNDQQYILHYSMHHIISDGWSMELLRKEVLAYYQYFVSGKAPLLPALRIQYRDYAAWQQQQMTAEEANGNANALRSFWMEHLRLPIPVLELPADKPRPPVFTYEGCRLSTILDRDLVTPFMEICQQQKASLYMGLSGVLNVLLYRYTGQSDIIIGCPVAGRDHVELESQIGFYINTLVLRTSFSGTNNFGELLEHVRSVTASAFQHQAYPFDKLVGELEVNRDLSRSPLFTVMMVLHNQQSTLRSMEYEAGAIKEMGPVPVHMDILFNVEELENGLHLYVDYNTSIYHKERIIRMVHHFKMLMAALTAAPQRSIKNIDYLSPQEQDQLVFGFNPPAKPYPDRHSIVALFQEQVTQTPFAIALESSTEKLTYQQLEAQSNRLAHYLMARGVRNGSRVPVCLDRSTDLIISILAILKAGAAYVPLDPSYPEQRIRYMLEDTGGQILVTQRSYRHLYEALQKEMIVVDEQRNEIEQAGSEAPAVITGPDDLAYMMYTSGSTGRPKGVMIGHRSVIRLVKSNWYSELSEKETLLSTGSISFDATTLEYWMMLLSGGRLVMLDHKELLEVERLKTNIRQFNAGVMWFTAGWLNQLVEVDISLFAPLKMIMTGGDRLSVPHMRKLRAAYPHLRLANVYGPTENTTMSLCHDMVAIPDDIPLGTPINGSTAYILDEDSQLVPIGVYGEICVGGDGLAHGYLNNPELTQQKFIAHPFRPQERLYRTGDIGRWREDGLMEFWGRRDDQVKIRGYRVELAEIEQTILQLPGVHSAVVITQADEQGQKRLIAYFTGDSMLPEENLRQQLWKMLPEYMIPSIMVQLDQLPLNHNGKVDKSALVLRDDGGAETATAVLPVDEKEALLLETTERILKRKVPGGVTGSFFEAGGDSIKAILLAGKLKQQGYLLSVTDMMQYPVLRDLARRMMPASTSVLRQPVAGEVPLTPIQTWYLQRTPQTPHYFNQSVLLHSKNILEADGLQQCLRQLLEHHDALRMVLHQQDGRWVQFNQDAASAVPWLEEHWLHDEHDAAAQVYRICEAVQQSFQLATGPLLKAALIHLPDGDRLLLAAHHLVVDGVSWRILLEDLSTLYFQHQRGANMALPGKTDSFRQWALKQQAYANSDALIAEIPFWRSIIQKQADHLLPDYPGGSNLNKDRMSVDFVLDQQQTTALLTKANSRYDTRIQEILLSALAISIRKVFELTGLLITVEGHGRQHAIEGVNIDRTVGWFTTAYPVWLTAGPGSPIDVLLHNRDHLRTIPNGGIGYGMLKYMRHRGVPELDQAPEPGVVFNYLGDFGSGAGTSAGEQLFHFASENRGREVDEEHPAGSMIGVTGIIVNEQLRISIHYSKEQFYGQTIKELTSAYERSLKDLIGFLCEGAHDYPLSYNQQEYCTNKSIAHAYGLYSFELETFDRERLQLAYQQLITHFEVLRLRYFQVGDEWRQEVLSPGDVPISITFIEGAASENDDTTITGITGELLSKPFQLEHGEVIRAGVLVHAGSAHVLLQIHHIVIDAWSGFSLRDYLKELYDQTADRSQVQASYLPFIKAQQQYLQSSEGLHLLDYWNEQLQALAAISHPHQGTNKSCAQQSVLAQEMVLAGQAFRHIKETCSRKGILLSSFILNAYNLYVTTVLKKSDALLAGIVVNGRELVIPGFTVGNCIGQFVTTLPIPFQYSNEMTYDDALRYTQENYMQGRMHQGAPFKAIEEAFVREHGFNMLSTMDVELNFINKSDRPLPAAVKNTSTIIASQPAASGKWLAVTCSEYADGMLLEWSHPLPENTAESDLNYSSEAIRQMFDAQLHQSSTCIAPIRSSTIPQ